jgi:hypothetical protein
MKQSAILVGCLMMAVGTWAEEEGLNPANLPAGSIVRVVARQPAINLARAKVVECTTNTIVVKHKKDSFTIIASNILEISLLEKASPTVTTDGQVEGDTNLPAGKSNKNGTKPTLWERIKNLWK